MDEVIAVVGGANLDVVARSDEAVQPATSNPGRMVSTAGGVGRNIAENLARLGARVMLVTVVGDDEAGRRLLAQTREAGVDVRHVVTSPHGTGSYTAVVGPDGELVVSVADMRAIDTFGPGDLPETSMREASLIIADGNLPAATLRRLLESSRAPVMIDPVSAPKAARIAPLLDGSHPVHTVTPDRHELAALSGRRADSDEEIHQAAGALIARGVQRVWVRQGARGSLFVTAGGAHRIDAHAVTPVDVTGAGDAMLAAYARGIVAGEDDLEAARDGAAAAYLTISCADTVRPDLHPDLIDAVRHHSPSKGAVLSPSKGHR